MKSIKKIVLILLSSLVLMVMLLRSIFRVIKKKKNLTGANNKIFLKKSWNNYQYFQFGINKLNNKYTRTKKKIIENIKKWEEKQFWFSTCNSSKKKLIKNSSENIETYLESLAKKKIPRYMGKLIPYYIIIFKEDNKIGCFLSHYYCDGQVFLDFLNIMTNSYQQINFLKYNYVPLFSDIKIFKYLINAVNSKKYSKKKMFLSEKSDIFVLKKEIDMNFKRYDMYAYIFNILFNYIPLNKLKVAFTVGIDDPYAHHNRIGVITRIISRQSSLLEYKTILKKKLQNSLGEALVCYDILKNFPVYLLRSGFNNNIDIVFTSFRFNNQTEKNSCCQFELSSFVGSGKIPIYINSITKSSELLVSLKISTDSFDSDSFSKKENCQLYYTFKTCNKQNIYYRRYINYRNKYLKVKQNKKFKKKVNIKIKRKKIQIEKENKRRIKRINNEKKREQKRIAVENKREKKRTAKENKKIVKENKRIEKRKQNSLELKDNNLKSEQKKDF